MPGQEPLHRDHVRPPEVGAIARPAPEPEQVRLVEVLGGQEDAGPDRGPEPHVARRAGHGPCHGEPRVPDLQRIADPGVQVDQHGGVDEDPAHVAERVPQAGRLGLDRAVERVAAGHGAHLEEAGAARARREGHGDEARDPGHRHPGARDRIEHRLDGVGEGAPRPELEVGAEQLPSLRADRGGHVGAERVDRDECGDAEAHGTEVEGEAPPAAPALTPRHRENEGSPHARSVRASETTLPRAG